MKLSEQKRALAAAANASKAAGKLMRQNLRETKTINESTQHDIKLELDVRCQKLIEKTLLASFPKVSVVGEEGSSGNPNSQQRWIIDPIDGTVNFTYGIPHACVSIALQAKLAKNAYETIVGVIYDPFTDELWTAIRGESTLLNGTPIRVSKRARLNECIVATGFAKSPEVLAMTLPFVNKLVYRVRKVRIMGSAALSLAYVATGRFDAYVERGISLWDIAAGGLLLECAGGEFWNKPISGTEKFEMIASNGLLRKQLSKLKSPSKSKNY
jgi:myo-inositol-1(or 4)-monophosphatase